jgi:hypothetical protein
MNGLIYDGPETLATASLYLLSVATDIQIQPNVQSKLRVEESFRIQGGRMVSEIGFY